MAKTAELVKQDTKLPNMGFDVSAFDNTPTGLEHLTARDLIIPRLTILQGLSPQVTRGKPEYDEDAKVGDVYDIGMHERFPDGIVFVPVVYQKQWLEWSPRGSGGGLVSIHDDERITKQCLPDEEGARNRRSNKLPNGNYIQETAQFYGYNVTAGFRRSFLPMASTQLKKARYLLACSAMERLKRPDGTSFQPPIYYRSYKLASVPESNAMGNWMGWDVEPAKAVPELTNNWLELVEECKAFREDLVKGELQGDMTGIEGERVGAESDAM